MTQPDRTTPTALSTGPWTIYVCENGHRGREHYPCLICGLYVNRIDVIPLSTLSRLVEELEARAAKAASDARNETDPIYAAGDWGADDAYRDAASLISESLPTPQEDE